ncbi:MAG: hypothetical protein KDB07_09110 [Planctomycetes bacterium]|nr:hypothetical protein [Planctomycetota bacterium]
MATSIYVSDREAIGVVVGGSAKKPKISRVERLEFSPPGFDEEGNAFPPEMVADVRAVELKQWVKQKRLGGKVAATLDASHVIFRDIFIEFSDRKQIDKVINYQVEGVIPSEPIESLCVGYVVDERSERGSRLTIAAAHRRRVRTLVEDLDFAQAKPMTCDSALGGILTLRRYSERLSHCDKPTVWVDLQDDVALLAVLEGEKMLSFRA